MSFHLVAYYGLTTSPDPTYLVPVTDMVLPSTATGFLLPNPLMIVAACANLPAGGGTQILRASIQAPSLLRVGYPYIRPIGHGETTDPNVMNLLSNPLQLPASENVSILIGATAADAPAYTLLWLADELVPVPQGEKFVLRFTGPATSVSPSTWTPVGTVSFDQSLPPGAYTVVGFEHWSPHAVAARLVFPGCQMRPGTLSVRGTAPFPSNYRTDRIFYEGRIGVYGSFNSFAPPSLEVLSTADDSAHEGYLTVIRTGDAVATPPHPGGSRTPR